MKPFSILCVHRLLDFLEEQDDRLCLPGEGSRDCASVAGYLFQQNGLKLCAVPASIWKKEVFPASSSESAKALDKAGVIQRSSVIAKSPGFTAAKAVFEEGPFTYVEGGPTTEFRLEGERYLSKSLQQRRSFRGRAGWYYILDLGRLSYLAEVYRAE